MSFYSDLANVGLRLLKDKGQQITFSSVSSDSFDPATGKNNTTSSAYTAYGASFSYNKNEIDGTIIQNGDIRLVIDSTREPITGDKATIDSIIYRVIGVKVTSPAGTPVIFEAQLRK